MNWPTRYRCRKCSRATSDYPLFCSKPDCPVKHDWWEDNKLGVGLGFLIIMGFVFYIAFHMVIAGLGFLLSG